MSVAGIEEQRRTARSRKGFLAKVAQKEAKWKRKHTEMSREFGFEVANGERSMKNSDRLRDLEVGVGCGRENERRRRGD